MTVPQARLVPALARYELRRKKLPFAGRTLSLVVPASIGEIVERKPLVDPDRQPYWAEIWPASVAIARLLMRGRELTGTRVLDVGCGLGLGGVAAGVRGAHVTFADREPEALAFARFNAEHNGATAVATLVLDWTQRLPSGPFDLMLLADVTYSESNHNPLLRLIDYALAPGGVALAADPYRAGGDVFAATAAARFFCQEITTDCFYDGARLPVRVVVIAKDEHACAAGSVALAGESKRA
jgi:predicted nicotinamide N-methyase